MTLNNGCDGPPREGTAEHPMSLPTAHGGQLRCGAKARHGNPCRQFAMANGRCKFHGGRAPWGPANGNWKHGKYSKYMPRNIRQRVGHMLADPDVLSLKSEILLAHVRISELIERLGESSNSEVWREIGIATEQLRRLVETETKLLESRKMMLSVDRVQALMTAIADVVLRHVPELERRRAIAQGIQILTDKYYNN
jgi:hypothetical protein